MNESVGKVQLTDYSQTGFRVMPLDLVVFAVSMLSAVAFLIINRLSYINSMAILPVIFAVCYLLLAAPVIRVRRSKTMIVFAICEFARCVFLPLFSAVTNYSGFTRYATEDGELILRAVLLMSWEMVFVFGFLALYLRYRRPAERRSHTVELGENKYAIYLIVLSGIVLFAVLPQVREYVNFLFLNADSEKVRDVIAGGNSSLFTGAVTYVQYAFLCVFVLILDYCSKKYGFSGKRRFILISTIAGLATVSVIFGESRAAIIYTLFAVLSCLLLKYREHKKSIVTVLVVGAVAVLGGMTVYRLFAAYNFASYSAAIEHGGYMGENYYAKFAEAYLLGPQSIAAGMEFKEFFSTSFTPERFLMDLFRPFMGINLILKNFGVDTSITLYNSWIYGTTGRSNGFFLQITSQGYCYFGFFFAPVFACFFMWLSARIEEWIAKTENLFVYFFLSYVFIRTSTCVLGGTMSGYITNVTMTLLVCGAFLLLQRFFGSILKKR